VLTSFISLVLVASPAERLVQAQKAFDSLEFDKVVALTPQPADWRYFTRSQVVQALSLRALSLASIKRDLEAATSFRLLFTIAPEFQLPEQFGPRVRTFMLEARDLAERDRLTITFDGGSFLVSGTAAGLAQRVVIGWDSKRVEFPLSARLEAPWPKETSVDAWAAVLGPGESVLAEWGTEATPRRVAGARTSETTPVRPDTSRTVPSAAALSPTASSSTAASTARQLSTLSVVGIVVGAAGVAAVGGGFAALSLAGQPEQALAQAKRDMQGNITSLSQRDAFALDAAAASAWQAAGGLLIAGGLAVATGITMFLLGLSVGVSPSSVSFSVPFDAEFGFVAGAVP
jgi:hypothetical protein